MKTYKTPDFHMLSLNPGILTSCLFSPAYVSTEINETSQEIDKSSKLISSLVFPRHTKYRANDGVVRGFIKIDLVSVHVTRG